MAEQWKTVEAITAAKERFEQALPDWRRPTAFGFGVLDEDGRIEFARVNDGGQHGLPAVVLATVCGYRGGTGSYPFTREKLERAISLLAPAEACTEFEHPNLQAWRSLLPRLGEHSRALAVFVADWNAASADPHVAALRTAAGR